MSESAEAEYAAVRLLVDKWQIPEPEAERLLENTGIEVTNE